MVNYLLLTSWSTVFTSLLSYEDEPSWCFDATTMLLKIFMIFYEKYLSLFMIWAPRFSSALEVYISFFSFIVPWACCCVVGNLSNQLILSTGAGQNSITCMRVQSAQTSNMGEGELVALIVKPCLQFENGNRFKAMRRTNCVLFCWQHTEIR